ncbi:3'(2'),5'-bisphosphate nucleotidase CysQ [Persephonella sp.]|uniref:3'(2'),5'-bisphosphate nucleotidase CysQ n=1 Tax=Persephonella sp. TaxID=2060922 RepID=UPI0025CF5863|nr:3'(2'),5'-bisphosphate nucleotidase CysQ [Persephonella sp.]
MENLLKNIIQISKDAGKEILDVYNTTFHIEYKDDKSPLTEADKRAHNRIENGLRKISTFPIISEEGKNISYQERKKWKYFWMVDPLDGTKEFIKKKGEFTVNIALIKENRPILGVVYAPAMDVLYYGGESLGAFKVENRKKVKIAVKKKSNNKITVVASKSHLNNETKSFIEKLRKHFDVDMTSVGSSLKICLVAEGKADIYPRLGPTMEWDTAAAHAVLNAAGGKIIKYEDLPLEELKNLNEIEYNKPDLLNPYFIAMRPDVF